MAEIIHHERRQHRRIPFIREVEVIGTGIFSCSNLSSGGLYLETVRTFLVGTVIELRFKLRVTDEHPMTIQACVVFVHEGAGIGFSFINLDLEDHEEIVRFIEQG